MKSKCIALLTVITLFLAGCSQSASNLASSVSDVSREVYEDSFDTKAIQTEIESRILSDCYVSCEIDFVNLHSTDDSHTCSLAISWPGLTISFLEQCYFILPGIIEVLNSYEYEFTSIAITSVYANDTSKLVRLDYYSDNEIIILDSTGADTVMEKYTFEQLNTLEVDRSNQETEEEAEQRAEEETRLKAKEEAKQQAEEEARLKAEEEAKRQTEKEATQNIISEEPAVEQATMVWIDDTAKRYHRKNGCGMDNAYQVTLDEAVAMGKTPCGRCYR